MTRPRPVHRLSDREAQLAAAIAPANEPFALKRARRLKEKIEAYWRVRNRVIKIALVEVSLPCSHAGEAARDYAFESDAVNGLPPKAGAP